MPKKFEPEEKEWVTRISREHRDEYPSLTAVGEFVGARLGMGGETLRPWVRQSKIDDGEDVGITSSQLQEITRLKEEIKRLGEDVAILNAATSFFVGELDPRKRT